MNPKKQDPEEKALAEYESAQREFENHPLWSRLKCKPEELFAAVRRFAEKKGIKEQQWQQTYRRAQVEIRTRVREQKQQFQPEQLQILSGIRV